MVLAAPNVMPRLLLSVIFAVTNKVPPFKAIELGLTEVGAVPKLASALIDKVPPVIVVVPEYVLVLESVVVPAPACVKLPEPEITWLIVIASERLIVKFALLTIDEELAIDPVVPPAPICRVPLLIVVVPV